MKAFSIDLRQRIVDAVKGGESMASASRRFEVSYSTVRNYLKLVAAGSLEPRKRKTVIFRKLKFTREALDAMKAWLAEKNDLTLKEIQQRLFERFGISVSLPAICGRLMAMDFGWKKNDSCFRA